MALRFDGRVAVVTGAGRGLGREYALLLARKGARVLVNDYGGSLTGGDAIAVGRKSNFRTELQTMAPSRAAAEGVVAEIAAGGGEAAANYDDVVAGGAAIVADAVRRWGRVDILICNAGILRPRAFRDYEDADWHKLVHVHLTGSYNCALAAWPHMCKQQYGRIVLTGSSAGLYGMAKQVSYSAAKSAMVGLGRALALEGRRDGVQCNVICPAAHTRLTSPDSLNAGDAGTQVMDSIRRLEPGFVAPLVVWLCHDSCKANGSIYEAGGGWYSKTEWVTAAGTYAGGGPGQLPTPEMVRDNFAKIEDLRADGWQFGFAGYMPKVLSGRGSIFSQSKL